MRIERTLGLVLCFVAIIFCYRLPTTSNLKAGDDTYRVGAGIYDITGPAAQVGMMGYAMFDQRTAGLHYRLRARAFVIGDSKKRIAFVSTDSCMIFTGVKQHVVERLQKLYGPNVYTYDNVLLSGIHTHAGPAGYSYYAMYDLTSWGFNADNFNTIVNGIVSAIEMATTNYDSNKGSKISINAGELLDSNINRSPTAYLANPPQERSKYKYDVDKLMTLLRIDDTNGTAIGSINWFSVHGTSMTNRNHLISGDNKGHASYLFELYKNGNDTMPGMGPFVAAFAQSNEGDVSPNTKGAFCDNGEPCESVHSTCNGRSENCHGYGPGKDEFESTEIIGRNQFKKAVDLYNSASVLLQGPVDFIHTFVDMQNVTVSGEYTATGETGVTCLAALGDSFAGGTTDGPGDFDFKQGVNNSKTNAYWNYLASFIFDPTPEQKKCQYPKPVLINTGGTHFPTPWTAAILPIQILRIGQLWIVGVPGEFTTMSGRRLRESVLKTLVSYGAADNNTHVVIAGLSNAYSHYITTFEEFEVQRYEGASTLYGPHTLAAYQQEFSKLAAALATGKRVPAGPTPPDLTGKTPSFLPPVIFDTGKFGSVYEDAAAVYERGSLAKVVFYGGNPRSDYRTQHTFLTVEKQVGSTWKVIKTDSHWETKYYWAMHGISESLITITWDITWDVEPGNYRIKTFGSSKWFGTVTPYEGSSRTFSVQ